MHQRCIARKDDGYSESRERGRRKRRRRRRWVVVGRGGKGLVDRGVGTRVGAVLRKGRRDVRFVRHRLPGPSGRRCFSLRSRFTFEKICALARELIGGNNEISDPIN